MKVHLITDSVLELTQEQPGYWKGVTQIGEVAVKRIEESLALCSTLERELAEARAVIADLLAEAVPVAAESGDAGMVYVEMKEAEWQDIVDATARATAFLAK